MWQAKTGIYETPVPINRVWARELIYGIKYVIAVVTSIYRLAE
jgi:hypothetical protein